MKKKRKKNKKKAGVKKSAPKQIVKKSTLLQSAENAIDRLSLVNNQALVLASQVNSSLLGNSLLPLAESVQRMNNQFVGVSSVLSQLQTSNIFSQLNEASSSIHAVNQSLANILKSPSITSANYLQNLLNSVPHFSNPLSSFYTIANSAHELSKINLVSDSILSQFYQGSNLTRIGEIAIHAERNLANILPSQIGSKLNLNELQRNSIINGINESTKAFNKIWKNYETDIEFLKSTNPIIQRIPPIEIYYTTDITEKISVGDKDEVEETLLINDLGIENEETLKSLLGKLDNNLFRMWQGALQALQSNNVDKIRHLTTSLRELFTHVMHKIAPDDEIKKWSTSPDYVQNGRPTRKARLLFICRHINDPHFKDFVEKDVDMMLKFIDLFQEGTHSVVSKLTEMQLNAIKCKSESAIKYLLQLHFAK